MALLVSDARTESFERPPPPKKKWIQNYLEKDCKQQNQTEQFARNEIAVQNVLEQFQDYIDESNKKSNALHTARSNVQAQVQMTSLLHPANNGAKFNNSLKRLSERRPNHTEVPPAQPSLSKQEIGGVVQGVISQFLNGNLADSDFRRSRKRCSKHENCSGRKGHKDRKRKLEADNPDNSEDVSKSKESPSLPPTVLERSSSLRPTPPSLPRGQIEDGGVLNLSLPKISKVTFAAEDRCYSSDALRSSKTSKSQEMYDMEDRERAKSHDDGYCYPGSRNQSQVIGQLQTVEDEIRPAAQSYLRNHLSVHCAPPSSPVNLVVKEARATGSVLRSPNNFSVIQHLNKDHMAQADAEMSMSRHSPQNISPSPPAMHVYDARYSPPHSVITGPSAGELVKSFSHPSTRNPATLVFHKPESIKDRKALSMPPSFGKLVASKKERKEVLSSPKNKEKTEAPTKEDVKKGSNSNREMHNRLEKNRRAHLKQCFDELARECELDPKKASNLTVIKSAYKYIMGLRRKERENEKQLASLVQDKIKKKQQLEELRRELPGGRLDEY